MAAVARRQTKHEAETMVARLANVVMVAIEVAPPAAAEQADPQEGEERLPPLSRVQDSIA